MKSVFEKIIEKFSNIHRVVKNDEDLEWNRAIYKCTEIVNQEAVEYNKDNYFNLDHTTLHKCPKCGADAEHRVNRKGLWACGCFKCNLFKTAYDHGKTIEAWEDFCAEYNNGWIPCSERLPEPYASILVCENNGEIHLCRYHNKIHRYFYDGSDWDIKESDVVAWQPLPEPYTKGE